MTIDTNTVTVTGEVVEHTSREYNGKTYWTTILLVRGSYYRDGFEVEQNHHVAISLYGKQADSRDKMPPGSRIKVEGSLSGRLGKNGGVFMSIANAKFALLAAAPAPIEEPSAESSASDGVPF